jgi:hypothetical protein
LILPIQVILSGGNRLNPNTSTTIIKNKRILFQYFFYRKAEYRMRSYYLKLNLLRKENIFFNKKSKVCLGLKREGVTSFRKLNGKNWAEIIVI